MSREQRRVDNERSYEQFCWQFRFTLKIQENGANQIVQIVAAVLPTCEQKCFLA